MTKEVKSYLLKSMIRGLIMKEVKLLKGDDVIRETDTNQEDEEDEEDEDDQEADAIREDNWHLSYISYLPKLRYFGSGQLPKVEKRVRNHTI